MPAFNPLDYPVCLAQPLRITPSAWIEHVPFGMFVVDALRPRTIVELGTDTGVSYCAFCQAVQEVRSDTRCYAVDTWEGDPHTGAYGPDKLADLRQHHDPLYGGFSRLIQSTFDQALAHFADDSVDLLHIDGYHTYEAARHDFETWLPKLSDRGVVLLHDANMRELDFGVWRFWEEIQRRYPSFEFLHGFGLGVALVGAAVPEALRALAEAPEGDLVTIQTCFHRLGERLGVRLQLGQEAEVLIAQIGQLTSKVGDQERLASELAAVAAERDAARLRLGSIENRLSWQLLGKAWDLQMRLAPPESVQGRAWLSLTRAARSTLRIARPPRRLRQAPANVTEVTLRPPAELSATARDQAEQALARIKGKGPAAPPADGAAPDLPAFESYAAWARRSEAVRYDPARAARRIEAFGYKPVISVVMPTYNSPPEYLRKALDSVLGQYYPYWELCICDDGSPEPHVREVLDEYAARDERVRVTYAERNGGIGAASNRALGLATGDFVALLDHDDELTPDALCEVAAALQDAPADVIYSDEDKLDELGRRCDPFFKPAWSLDLTLSGMYTCHLSVYRKGIVDQIGGFNEDYHGGQDWDLLLRAIEQADTVVHIPKVLYHWRKSPTSAASGAAAKPWIWEAARRALADSFARRGVAAEVGRLGISGFYRVRRAVAEGGKVSIVIPTRDRAEVLRRCVESIELKTDYPYPDYEIIIVDNGSRDRASLEYLARTPHRVLRHDPPASHAQLCNLAAAEATGDYLLLLHDDTEVLAPEWLSALIEHAQRPEVGVVGAKLLAPEGSVQHAGIVLGLRGVAHHALPLVDGHSDTGHMNFPNLIRNCSAVSDACLLIRRELYAAMNGLNEGQAAGFGDVDLCLRLQEAGHLIVYTPYALLRHHTSTSPETPVDPRAVSYMVATWGARLANDPYYHPSLSPYSGDFNVDFLTHDSLHCVLAQEGGNQILGFHSAETTLGQEFYVSDDGLCAVAVWFGAPRGRPGGTVRFHLRESRRAAGDLRSVEADAMTLPKDGYHVFAFDPVADSGGKTFYFAIELLDWSPNSTLTVVKDAAIDATVGPYYENGTPGQGTIAFKAYCPARPFRSTHNPRPIH